jgi:hypothetical protein
MNTRGPYARRTNRIADMLMKRNPEMTSEFAETCAKASWIADISDAQFLAEAEHKAAFLHQIEAAMASQVQLEVAA